MKKKHLVWMLLTLVLLALVGTDQYLRHRRSAADLAVCRRHIERLSGAVESHARRNGRPPETLDRLVPRTLPALPLCPASNAESYSAGYKVVKRKDGSWGVTVACSYDGHRGGAGPLRKLEVTGFDVTLPTRKR